MCDEDYDCGMISDIMQRYMCVTVCKRQRWNTNVKLLIMMSNLPIICSSA